MQSEKNIKSFLQAANIANVSSLTGVSRPTLIKMKSGNFDVHFKCVKAVSDYIDKIFQE